jgi:galactokinase
LNLFTCLSNFSKYDDFYDRLVEKGLSKRASVSKANMLAICCSKLIEQGADKDDESVMLFIPGRIELFGKHTDYAGGRSILAAIERGFCFVAVGRNDNRINIFDMSSVRKTSFNLNERLIPEAGHWTSYPVTAARRIARNFGPDLKGADIAFASDLPSESGMSSSSALIAGFSLCIAHVNRLHSRPEFALNIPDDKSMAGYLEAIENGHDFGELPGDIGTGSLSRAEAYTALMCCTKNRFSQYSFCPATLEREIPLPEGYVMGIATSGVKAGMADNILEKHNMIYMLTSVLVDIWNRHHTTLFRNLNEVLLDSGVDYIKKTFPAIIRKSVKKDGLDPGYLIKRLEHFIRESLEIVPAAGDSLLEFNIKEFGRLALESQNLGVTHLGNQTPQTIFLTGTARKLGAPASSAFNTGPGGSVWALVPVQAATEGFFFEWANEYRTAFPESMKDAEFFSSWLGPASFRIEAA